MSHFTVAVFTDGRKSVDELLAPYYEGLEVAPYISETRQDIIDSAKKTKERLERRVASGEADASDDWVKKYLGAETDEELYQASYDDYYDYNANGDKLSTYNPNSKWDWYSVGGRCSGLLRASKGERGERSWCNGDMKYKEDEFDSALVSDCKFDPNPEQYAKAVRFWEVYVEELPLNEGEDKGDFHSFWNKNYYLETYHDKETYAKCVSAFTTFAVVLPTGEWFEKGSMGWWGVDSATPDEKLDWDMHYKERFLDTAKPEWTLTIVDCHI